MGFDTDGVMYRGTVPYANVGITPAIPEGTNLNTYISDGKWHQGNNAGAAAGSNYPEESAGLLEVVAGSGTSMVYQRYTVYSPRNAVYTRGRYDGTWSTWQRLMPGGMATGRVSITFLEAGTVRTAAISFPARMFRTTPQVVATVNSGVPQNCSLGVNGINTSGAVINLFRTGTTTTDVYWIAIGD